METSLPLRQIDHDVFVAPQLEPAAMPELARLGLRSVVNNRPDFAHGPQVAASLALLARFYERFADQAVSVAKRLDFAATGEMPTT